MATIKKPTFKKQTRNKQNVKKQSTPIKQEVKKQTTASKVITGVSVDIFKLESAALLFAFHESSKCQYEIRMTQSGASNNPSAAEQRISGLKNYYNSRLNAIHNVYKEAVSSKAKTKRIEPEIDNVLSKYYPENTNSKTPIGYSWPAPV